MPAGSDVAKLVLIRWSDKSMGAVTSSSGIAAGHGVNLSISRWTPDASVVGRLRTYTDPAGTRQTTPFEVPLQNLSRGLTVEFGIAGAVGTYVFHLELANGTVDVPLVLTQDIVDLQTAGAKYCPTPPSFAPLVVQFAPATVRPGDSTVVAMDGWTTSCERVVLALAGVASLDGRFTRATGPDIAAVSPGRIIWQVPNDLPAGKYIGLVWYPSAWREIELTVTR